MVRVTSVLFTLLLLCGLSAAPLAYSQTLSFEKTWGGTNAEYGFGVAVDDSGNIYVTGRTSFGAGGGDVVLLRFNATGSLIWQKTWGGTAVDEGYGVAVGGSGNIYVTGSTQSFGGGGNDAVLLKLDASGLIQWQRTYGDVNDEVGRSVAVDSSGSVYVAGYKYGLGAGSYDVMLLKFSSGGDILWERTWGGTNAEYGYGVAVDGSGNVYVTGSADSLGAGYGDVLLLKFDTSGALQWQKTWGRSTFAEYGYDVAVDSSGNIYVTGVTGSFGAESADVVLAEFDSSGTIQWQKTWGGTSTDRGYGVAVRSGEVYFAGVTESGACTLGAMSGIVTTPSGTIGALTLSLGTPTYVLATPLGTVGTPTGSETYAGGSDLFLLGFSIPVVVADLSDLMASPTDSMTMVIGDLALNPHGSKPSGVGYQQGRDTTPLGYLRGMVNNTQPSMFDTNVAVNATSGRPLSSIPQTLIFSIGGPGINSVTHYYEGTSNASDQAPIKFGYDSTDFYWTFSKNGTEIPGSRVPQSSTSVPPGTSDVFVIQVLRDADGRLVVLMYGTRYTGTWAAAEYFKFNVYPTITSWTDSYYIVRWTDAASGTSANMMPDSGDSFTILAQG